MSSGKLKKKIFKNIITALFIISLMISAIPAFASAATIEYTYDDTGQLTEAKYVNDTKINYAYDTSGNRETKIITSLIPDISATPSPLDFGNVGSAVTQTITVSNPGTADLIITSVSITGANASEFIKQTDTCSNTTVAPSGTCQIAITLTPSSMGQKTATLTIPSNDPDTPNLNISMSGNAIGYILTVNKNGTSTGIVTATGIDCGTDCAEPYTPNTQVTLTAQAGTCSTFAGWSGGECSGTGTCTVTMNADTTVTATFNMTQPAAEFSGTPVTGSSPLTVNFIDLSSCATSWSWTFGDSGTSTLQNPSHIYNQGVGSYNVSLTATNATGSGVLTKTNYISVTSYTNSVKNMTIGVLYSSLQAAYDAASSGDDIRVWAASFIGDLNVDEQKIVTLSGGYDSTFTNWTGNTYLKGKIETYQNGGTLTIKNFILEQ